MTDEQPQCISDDELAYLQVTQRDVELATAIRQSFLVHLGTKYGLNNGDSVNTDSGVISRQPTPTET